MSDTPKDAKGIFSAAVAIDDAAERAAFLDRSCGGDPALRQRVEDLLRAYGQPDGPLDKLAAALASTELPEPIREQVGATIGPYKLMEQIGEGGFGLVFVAEQERPIRRKVALKIIKPGMDTRDVIARFEAERQALAMMDHPNIARVLDAGTTESGRPYFVMELVRGIPITDYCDQSRLNPQERLALFVSVCHAVQHAHQKGIIHRDIKPSNVLVTSHDGQPVVKIIDFGVAKALHQKLTDRTIYTRFAQMIGTPLYMSPEQAEMSGLEIDTRTDVYSLGVLLYELLTGTTPFDRKRLAQAAYDELIRIIRDEEPPKPSTRLSQSTESLSTIAAQRRTDPAKLSRMFRGDLDWITMKSLEKDRTRRYGSARELAEDIERFERGDPIIAKPPTLRYLLGKYVRRNRLQIGTAAAILAAVIAGTAFEFYRIDRDRRDAIRSRHEAVEARAAAESAREQALLREQEAHQQKKRAEAALKDAQQQRKLAEENFRQTRQAVDKYFTLISESRLIDIPGAEPLRKELLNGALEYYQKYDQKFPNAKSDVAEVQAELAAAHFRMSQIEFFTGAGDWLSESEKGYDIVERLLAAKTPIEKFKSLDAGVTDVGGRPNSGPGLNAQIAPRALKIFGRGARLWEQLVAARPSSIGFRNDLATILLIIGNLKLAMGVAMGDAGSSLLDEALRAHTKAQDLWQALSTEHPEVPRFRAGLAQQMLYVTNVMTLKKKYSESLGLLRRARALCLELSNEFPGVPQYRNELAVVYSSLTSVHLSTGNLRDAVGAMRNWLAVGEQMVADFPTVPANKETLRATCNYLENVLPWKLSSLASSRDDVLSAFDLYAEVVERQRAIQLSRTGEGEARLPSPPSGEDLGSTFPFPTAHLSQQGLSALSALFRKAKETDRADLVKAFIERAHRGIGHGGKTYRMAEVALRWWSGQRDEVVKTLESYVRDTPDDSQFQLALVRARAATGQDSKRSDGETDKLLDGLFMALTNPANDAESVRKTVQSIRRLDPEGQLSGARWQRLLRHENPRFRRLAVSSLPEGPAQAKVVAAALEQALSDSDPGVRIAAADRLWTIRHDARQVVPVVVACLGDAFADVRLAAVKSLAAIGPAAQTASSSLKELLNDPVDDIRLAAATALWRIGRDGSGIKRLEGEFRKRDKFNKEDAGFRLKAIRQWSEMGPAAADRLPALCEALNACFQELRKSLGTNGTFASVPPDVAKLNNEILSAISKIDPKDKLAASGYPEIPTPAPDFRFRVVASDGRPVRGATVQITRWSWQPLVTPQAFMFNPPAISKSDSAGFVSIGYPMGPARSKARFLRELATWSLLPLQVSIKRPGYADWSGPISKDGKQIVVLPDGSQVRASQRSHAVGASLPFARINRQATGGQRADPNFDVSVPHPAYTQRHPTVLFDEAHRNFHTAGGRYKAFADLMTNDGYRITPNREPFTAERLAPYNLLIVANAPAKDGESPSAFTGAECDSVVSWVRGGGCLLLITDIEPWGSGSEELGKRFGVDMSLRVTVDEANKTKGGLLFSRKKNQLGDHPILRGRNDLEQVNRVLTFSGQSLKGPPGSVDLLKFAGTAVDIGESDRRSAAGRAQAIAFKFGRGRVVVMGEAGDPSAQVHGNPPVPMGMNVPGCDNRKFGLNIVHWLSGLMD